MDGKFTVKGAYQLLTITTIVVPYHSFIWKAFLPPSSSTLSWRILHMQVPTDEILQSRGIVSLQDVQCVGKVVNRLPFIFDMSFFHDVECN